jgi:hypothetical protein
MATPKPDDKPYIFTELDPDIPWDDFGLLWDALTNPDYAPAWGDLLPDTRALFAVLFQKHAERPILTVLAMTERFEHQQRSRRN